MKTRIKNICTVFALLVSSLLTACSGGEEDNRSYEAVAVVGVKVDGTLYLPKASADSVVVTMAAGVDLSSVKVQLLVENGTATGFTDNAEYDMRKPMALNLHGYDGNSRQVKLCVQSPPKLTSLSIARVDVPQGNVYTSAKSIIVQVAPGTDLSRLAVTMEFVNGTLQGFENGVERDYSSPVSFSVLGVDGVTAYPYQLVVTTDQVGPASIKSLTINGMKTTKVAIDGTTVIPYVRGLTDFTNATLTIETGYGNEIDPTFQPVGIDLLAANTKVTITGTNGQPTEFTIASPQLDPEVMFINSSASMGLGGNDLGAVGFSGSYVLTTRTSDTKAPIYIDLTGKTIGQLSATGCTGIGYGFRKFAVDDDGVILGSSLGISGGAQWVYKWTDVTAVPTQCLSFSKADLGVNYNPRAAGLNIKGSLSGNATVTMAMAQQADIMIWKVSNGQAGKAEKYTSPVKFGYYAAVEPLPDDKGYIISATASGLNGMIVADSRLNEQFRLTGMVVSDVTTFKHNGRVYLAYTVIINSNQPTMRICDITDGQKESYQRPILDIPMRDKAANGNTTTDAAFKVIGGKLYAAFCSSNSDLYLFKLEQ